AALEWLTANACDFVLAFGDDWTDEDMFRALPPQAYSVRVSLEPTTARFRLTNPATVRRILRDLTSLSAASGKRQPAGSWVKRHTEPRESKAMPSESQAEIVGLRQSPAAPFPDQRPDL
ncbi:MAG TPA: hypothetical protein VKA67_06710, partial [Verrucomicrobiae bacterium]|nr:hypothetical protein [Verrucomicrobiae bacterium]